MAAYWYLAGAVLAALAALLVWLWRRLRRLERQFQEYRQALARLGGDLSEFRALSVKAEEQLGELAGRIEALGAWLKEREDPAGCGEPAYRSAVERIRRGAEVEELVASLGLSYEEAALLIRLHRKGA